MDDTTTSNTGAAQLAVDLSRYELGWHESDAEYSYIPTKGPSETVLREMSHLKGEPLWMLQRRLRALRLFARKPLPLWGPDLTWLDFDEQYYYLRPTATLVDSWDAVPDYVKRTYDRLGIPEAERAFLAGVSAMWDSETVYHRHREDLELQGILYCDMDTALREHPHLVKQHFGTVIPAGDNKFAAVNSAFWSGGSFIYVPPGVHVDQPLSAYFRINAERSGQFERTLIVVDEGASVSYLEGCSSPAYAADALHAAVVEIVVRPGARCEYITLQNWAPNIGNLVTKRARVEAEGTMRWVDANAGSRTTMKFPGCWLVGPKAHGEVISVAFAGAKQHQETGAKMVHAASETTSRISAKSISAHGGTNVYRGLVRVEDGAHGCRSHVTCDALLLDDASRTSTYPYMEIASRDAVVEHEASVSKVSDEQRFYLMSRGLSEMQATSMIVSGFAAEFTSLLPTEYAVEFTRLLELEIEGGVG
jgi:Fe-S cluster assembly protein SufB